MKKTRDILSRSQLFGGLPGEHITEIEKIAVDKNYNKGDVIFYDGDEGNGFYLVAAGSVSVYKLSPDGKEQILHIFGPGEPFGEVPVFEGRRFPAHALALEESRLLFFPRTAFVALIKANPSLALSMLAVLSRRLRGFAALVDDLSLKEVPARLAKHLLYLSESQEGSDQVALDIPKAQLAALLGTIPETLSRILTRMTKQGLIELDGPRVTILYREGLHELAEGLRRL